MEKFQKLLTVFVSQERVVEIDLRNAWNAAQYQIFNARLRGSRKCPGVYLKALQCPPLFLPFIPFNEAFGYTKGQLLYKCNIIQRLI